MGLSGVSGWGSDIGGFFAIGDRLAHAELLTRWVQFGAVSGVMRTQANGVALPSSPAAGDRRRPDRQLAALHEAAHPALPLPGRRAAGVPETGMPLDAPWSLANPATRAATSDDEFLFGPDCSPRPCSTRAPSSASSTCRAAAGSSAGGRWPSTADRTASCWARPRRAAATRRVPAPLEELPLLARPARSCRCCRPRSTRYTNLPRRGRGQPRDRARRAQAGRRSRAGAGARPRHDELMPAGRPAPGRSRSIVAGGAGGGLAGDPSDPSEPCRWAWTDAVRRGAVGLRRRRAVAEGASLPHPARRTLHVSGCGAGVTDGGPITSTPVAPVSDGGSTPRGRREALRPASACTSGLAGRNASASPSGTTSRGQRWRQASSRRARRRPQPRRSR